MSTFKEVGIRCLVWHGPNEGPCSQCGNCSEFIHFKDIDSHVCMKEYTSYVDAYNEYHSS
jgi:hypothetical protein